MFKLKVIEDEEMGLIMSDTKHRLGGVDMTQEIAFSHLFPTGECHVVYQDLLFDLAEAHGWTVEIRKIDAEIS